MTPMNFCKENVPLYLLPALSALFCWLAVPGDVGCWPVATFALIPLFLFLQKSANNLSSRAVFLGGFIYGLLLSLLLLYWIVNVLAHYGGLPVTVAIAALLLLSCYMACYPALFLALSYRFISRFSPLALLFIIPSLWTGLEWLRGWLLSGFPWMDFGCYPAFSPIFLQGAAIFGHYGLSWLLVFCNVTLWLFITKKEKKKIAACALPILLGYLFFSFYTFTKQDAVKEKSIRPGIVQGNVAQDIKWAAPEQQKTISTYLELSGKLACELSPPDFLVWPETALPFYPQESPLTRQILSFVSEKKLPLVCGAPWYELDQQRKPTFYNAALLLAPNKEKPLGGVVFKSHLVPFGEYIPLQDLLPIPGPLVESAGNFSSGEITTPLHITAASGGEVDAGVLICYESVFSELSRHWVNAGATILLNLTNDAWYGKTSAPKHTLAMTILRAVETRRSVVRSANTGFSSFILPSGRLVQQTKWFTPAVIQADVPLRTEKTLFVCGGWMFAPFCFFISLFFVFWRSALWKKLVAKKKA